MSKQYPKRIECKYSRDQIVWVLSFSHPQRAIVTKIDCEVAQPAGKPRYDVMLLDGGNTEVNPDTGSVTICGLEEWRVYEEPIGAARELYQIYANMHHEMGIALQNCTKVWDDSDAIVNIFKKYEEWREEG